MTTYYKALDARGRSCHGGSLTWSLPTWDGETWTPGAWMPAIPNPVACQRGYHAAVGERGLLHWLHEQVYVIESLAAWTPHGDDGKAVTAGPVRLTRGTAWDERVARLFAVASAVDVLPLYEVHFPDDPRVSNALVTAWEYAHAVAAPHDLVAARAAAGDAAQSAARDAAQSAARDAAWAARDAAGAAWDAAGDARDAAGDAAQAAAGDAARSAAGAAARSAARDAQAARLARYLDGEVDV